jgi:hypothetical protein
MGMRVKTFRAIPVALSWIVFQSATASYIHGNSIGQLIANHLPLGGVFFLTVLVFFLNPMLHRIRRGVEFSAAELVVIWVMISAASAVPGYGMMEFFFPFLAAPAYFVSAENQWREALWPHLPEWLYVANRRAAEDFYIGEVSSANIPWGAWTAPAVFWITFSLAFFGLLICWSAIVRRQWIERERYPFPLVQVPALVMERLSPSKVFNAITQSPFFWVGVSIALLIHLLKGLHHYWPFIPFIPTEYSFSHLITEKPWNALFRGWPLYGLVYLSVIGVAYFLQLDVSLSLWFFFLLYKFQEVFFTAFSITGVSTQHQVMGADLALMGFLIWMARRHLYDVIRKALSPRCKVVDANEPMSYRAALVGIGASLLILTGMLRMAGMSLGVVFVFLFLLWLMATITTWMVANAGMLIVNIGVTPFGMLTTFFGTRIFGPRNLTLMAFDRSVISTWSSESLMPYVLQSFRLADYAPVRQRQLPILMAVAILVAVVVAYYSSLVFIYRQGALNLVGWVYSWSGQYGLNQANYAIQYPRGPNTAGIYSAAIGAGVTGFLLFMRHRFLWWPLHPLGYVVGVTYAPFHLWFSVVLGWAIKLCILKLGGFGAYREYRPFFLGLIFGEYFMAAFWSFVGLFTKVSYWGLPH